MKLIQQGAEAKIYLTKNNILKSRTPKTYRHPTIDKNLRTRRTKREAKILIKAKEVKANVPQVLTNDQRPTTNDKFEIYLEFIPGDRLSQTLNNYPLKKQISTMQKLGRQIKRLHNTNIIHADLTTSNTILQTKTNKLFIIDFGLSYISTKTEDKAVDLHLLKQALQAKHFTSAKSLFTAFRSTYKNKDALERLKIVESRGRYKH